MPNIVIEISTSIAGNDFFAYYFVPPQFFQPFLQICNFFRGFFLQVRTVNGTDPEGTFEEHPKFRHRDCPDSHGKIRENRCVNNFLKNWAIPGLYFLYARLFHS